MRAGLVDDTLGGVKSSLLPLSPVEASVEALIERLPRRQITVELTPRHQITVVNAAQGEFKSTGATPYFDMQLVDGDLDDVWLYIEASLVRNSGNRQARLEGRLAGGTGAIYTWPITTNLRGTVREVVFLPRGLRQLRWIPTTSQGFFTQSPMLVHNIGAIESGVRRWYRVATTWGRLRHRPALDRHGLSLWGAALDLQCAYRQTALIRAAAVRGDDYPALLARQERAWRAQAAWNQQRVRAMQRQPVFSLLVAVHGQAGNDLQEMIRSVRRQSYRHWELMLVADRSVSLELPAGSEGDDPRVRTLLADAGDRGPGLLSRAAGLAHGDFIGILDAQDLLQPDALLLFALEVDKYPEADIVYGDEDGVDRDGQRQHPQFKPDWNPDLLLSTNYVGAAAMVRRATAARLDFFRPSAAGAEMYDLILRLVERGHVLQVAHVPRVVCSRLVGKTGECVASEPLAPYRAGPSRHGAEMSALEAHVQPMGAVVEPGFAAGFFRVRYGLPVPPPLVSLIVPTRDRLDVLQKCISSIQTRTVYPNWELLVVDNGSSEPATLQYLQSLSQDSRIRVLRRDEPFNFAALNNYAVGLARGEVLGLLNNDLEAIEPDWLSEMVSHAVRPEIGVVGAKLLYPDGMVQHAGVVLGIGGVAAHVHKFMPADAPGYGGRACIVQNLSAVTGACMVVRTELYWQVGGMDQVNLAVAFNDIDFCLKLRAAGYRNLYTPFAVLIHHESISRGRDDTPHKRQIFEREYSHMRKTWRDQLHHDPAYNPNLTLEFSDFSFASQPWMGSYDQ